MKILLLGGSNAGIKDGWAVQFAERAQDHEVENRFLGAVGSLYGLMALLKRARDGAEAPDLIVFEYCLNDILLLDADVLEPALIEDALEAVMDFCAHAGIGLFLLCLEPRPADRQRRAKTRVQKIYRKAAQRRSVAALWLSEVFERRLGPAHFQDENHLTTGAAKRIADALLAALRLGVPAPSHRHSAPARFSYVDAAEARFEGPCALRALSSRVFDGDFLEISRGGASVWPGEGRLAGLMLRSSDDSGVFKIQGTNAAFRKSPRSQMQELVRHLMLLHYPTRRILSRGEIEIAMPEDERDLMRLPEDRGLLIAPSIAPFERQTLDIHGVIFWRKRTFVERLQDVFRSVG
ncbi:SGNH/GDSL hydrolase family protein [Methylocystis iwaonis]|uniref:SGNH/GDSL hydrolase family protein n=1 Tax=Methylocystis iwaonis TaxID=2885079 RepID=UPI002E7BEEF0|nr:SGNH/GDSL hydrolase family protein [Methylocystis iwaonis]